MVKDKILPYKHTIAAMALPQRASLHKLPMAEGSRNATLVLWWDYKGYLITLEIIASKDVYVERAIVQQLDA